jgi:hypothetical protein
LVERLGGELATRLTPPNVSVNRPAQLDQPFQHSSTSISAGLSGTSTAPLLVIRDVATEFGVDRPDETNLPKLGNNLSHDIIEDGLISLQDALSLLQLSVILRLLIHILIDTRFNDHYGRWVYFNTESSSRSLLAEVRKSPLLLCACCLIAIRHTSQEAASRLAPQFFKEASTLLSTALLIVPQSICFFQAALVLSQWSTTIAQIPLSIDSWLLSGFALQHCHPTNLFDHIMTKNVPSSMTRIELDRWCIWNHLCLVHLQYTLPLPISVLC